MKFIHCFFFTLFLFTSLNAQEEIIVQLDRESSLKPIQLSFSSAAGSGFDQNYIDKIKNVFTFDLNNNGMTEVVSNTSANAMATCKVEIVDKKMSLVLTIKNPSSAKTVQPLTLSGNLNEDRRKVHQVADVIYETLFGGRGIASKRILYTHKAKDGSDATLWKTDVWECDYDGANARKVTREGKLCVTPTYINTGGAR